MRKSGRIVIVAVLVAVLAVSAGCSRRADEPGQVTICFAFQDLETEYWVAAHKAVGLQQK